MTNKGISPTQSQLNALSTATPVKWKPIESIKFHLNLNMNEEWWH